VTDNAFEVIDTRCRELRRQCLIYRRQLRHARPTKMDRGCVRQNDWEFVVEKRRRTLCEQRKPQKTLARDRTDHISSILADRELECVTCGNLDIICFFLFFFLCIYCIYSFLVCCQLTWWIKLTIIDCLLLIYCLYTFCFVDDVVFSHNIANGPESKMTYMFRLFARWRHQGRSMPSLTAFCFLQCSVLSK